jgi:hypothetical protein
MAQRFRVLLGIIAVYLTGTLCAETLPGVKGFNQDIFQYHFDRADRETDPSSWMDQARLGRELALGGWERTALELYADPELRETAEREVSLWSEEELERRFTEWLFRRFFTGSREIFGLAGAVDSANRAYAYHTGEDGNISYNAETGEPELVRPQENRDAEADRQAWRALVLPAAEAGLASYADNISFRLPEILCYIPEEQRIGFQSRLAELYSTAVSERGAEFRALLAREERLFIARRTGDLWSLRRQSESESASAVTARLLEEAGAVCAAGIASLETRMESARAGTGDLALAGENWLEAFREQFERGIKAWESAEENFLVRRMEWERDSGEYFLAGQEAWKNAFTRLEQERLLWEDKAKELFDAGEKLFSEASLQLRDSIAGAKAEFERDAELRTGGGVQRVKAWVDMYVTCGSVLSEVRESVSFWLSRFVDQKAPENALESGNLGTWVENILRSYEQNPQAGYLTAAQKTAAGELVRWSALYVQYRDKAAEAKAVLEGELALALGLDSGPLSGVPGMDSENFHLDEYQVEILRAQAAAAYWQQRLAAAEAVSAYAQDITAGRLTEAESLERWKNAKAAYDAAVNFYSAAHERLSAAGLSSAAAGEAMREAASALAGAERRLEELNSQYALQMAAYRINSGSFILEELGAYYASLVESNKSRAENSSYYTAYLSAARDYFTASDLDRGWTLLGEIAASPDTETRRIRLSLLYIGSAADWYFVSMGIEAGTEERAALELEGVGARLVREAENNEQAERLLGIYRELAPFSQAARRDAVSAARRGIVRVFAEYGIETEPARFPPANLAGAALVDYCAEYGLELGEAAAALLVRIGQVTEFLPGWIDNELESWKQSFLDYMAVKTLYGGFAASGNAEAAAARYEELSAELEARYFAGESVEAIALEAAYSRYLCLYLSSYENYLNESTGQDAHWRVYITSPFLDEYNLGHNDSKLLQGTIGENGNGIGGALSFAEGLLADSRETAEYERKKLESAFSLFTGIPGTEEIRFAEAAEKLFSDPEYVREYTRDKYALEVAHEFYLSETKKLQNRLRQEESIKSEIARLGSAYEKIPSGTAAQLEVLSSALNEFRAEYQDRLEQYKISASAFAAAGAYYESLYTESKNRFDSMEKARLEYEKQDAVQRWASTAYLKQGAEDIAGLGYYREPEQELAYVHERNERAQVALLALKDLYGNGEEKRPYNDAEYNRLYAEYQASFTRMFLAHKARQEFEKTLASEKSKNAALYGTFSSQAAAFLNPALPGYLEGRTENAVSGAANPWFDYLRINEQGRLALAYNPVTFKLDPLSTEEADSLSGYFRNGSYTGNGENQASSFEKDLAAWTGRMTSYNLKDPGNFQRWGLALDFLVSQLVKNNSDIEELKSSYTTADFRESGDVELDGQKLSKRLSDFSTTLNQMQEQAWNEMSGQEKSDLQFLAAMLLTGGGDAASGLTQISELKELEHLANRANSYIFWKGKVLWFTITIYEWPYLFDHSELNMVFKLVNPYKDSVDSKINASQNNFNSEIKKTAKAWNDYDSSCKNLGALTGLKENGETEWSDLKNALKKLDLSGEEVKLLEDSWNDMLSYYESRQQPLVFSNNAGALEALMIWARGMRNGALEQFEAGYAAGENSRREAQSEYRAAFDAYISGAISLDQLNASAEAAYGNEAPAFKNHLGNLGSAMLEDLSKTAAEKSEYAEHYRTLASEYAALIQRSYQARFAAELSARELEWAEREKDLNEKILAWREAAALVLERGRADWKSGAASMQESCDRWAKNFTADYERISAAWNTAYLESLTEKEDWMNRAMEAADGAYTGALLASVGSDAEVLSRRLDVFIPSSLSTGGIEEAEAALNRVFATAGIANLSQALSALSGDANTAFTRVRSGTSGIGVWNAGQVLAAARELAGRSTANLAAGKMAILAVQARETALAAKQALTESVENANRQFDDSMDETFVMGGGWSRSGKDYVREVIVHSTFFEKMITDRAVVGVYRRYVMEQWDFATDISESYLEGLDYLGIQALIGLAQKEVQEKSSVIFGSDDRMGEFDRWIGKAAVLEKEKVTDQGSGELGRLLTEYYKWYLKQAEGAAIANRPLWDKPLWDSRGSWFSAPSLRTIADIGVTLAAAAFAPAGGLGLLAGVAINLADDFFFSTMDVVLGDKSLAEAGFAFGQKILTTAITSTVGTVFNGFAKPIEGASGFFNQGGLKAVLAGPTGSLGHAFINPVLTGVQTFTTNAATSALNSITYDDESGFGWSKEGFKSGMAGLAGAVSSSVSTLTSGLLNTGLEGFYDTYYKNGQDLSVLAGGLAGEGINYAFGGDITLNPFNLGFLNGSLASTGLLELHFGRNGFNTGLGTGGVDVSTGTLVSAAQGLEAWKVNFEIWLSDSAGAKKYISQMRTLYSGGQEEAQMYEEILSGNTRIYENKNVNYTETIYDPVTGYKNILLGEDAFNDGSRFGLNVVFSHEAYRNGINDGSEQQEIETASAFAGHVKAAYGLITTYGEGAIGGAMAGEANNYGVLVSGMSTDQEKDDAFMALMQSLDGYDSSADYWKLVQRSDGSYGWSEDGSLDFNFDLSDSNIRSMFYNQFRGSWGSNEALVSIAAEQLTDSFLNTLEESLGIKSPYFKDGTHLFIEASKAAKTVMNKLSNANLNAFNMALMRVQHSGLLVKNQVKLADNLNGLGTDQTPYLPLTGKVLITCLAGERFVTEGSFGNNINFPLYDFAKQKHPNVDMVSEDYNVVSSVAGTLELNYDPKIYGLQGILTSMSGNLEFTSNHLASQSIMNYLSVFGMQGTALRIYEGKYILHMPAGVTFGTMGSTGQSFGNHLDFGVKNLKNPASKQVFSQIFTKENYKNMAITPWAEKYSGKSSRDFDDKDIKEYLMNVSKSLNLE